MTKQVRLAFCGVLCVFFGLQLVSSQSFCQYQGNNGFYDLSVLTQQITAPGVSGDGWTYYFKMCDTVTQGYCTSLSAMVCQTYQSPVGNTFAIGYPNDQGGTHKYEEKSNGIIFTAYGAQCGQTAFTRISQFTITCDPTVTGPISSITNPVTYNDNCVYFFSFSHALACTGGGGGSSDGGSGGLSGGSVFLIIFFVSAFVYVAGGCFYKRYQKGTTGMIESCPNNEFWTAIPGLFKDGCLYTVRKLKSLCGGGGGSSTGGTGTYETI